LNRAGFSTTTVDVEDLTINYPSIWELMQDLRDMGESNAILGRRNWVSRDVLLAAEGIYKGGSPSLLFQYHKTRTAASYMTMIKGIRGKTDS
jgi:hypothetical protein